MKRCNNTYKNNYFNPPQQRDMSPATFQKGGGSVAVKSAAHRKTSAIGIILVMILIMATLILPVTVFAEIPYPTDNYYVVDNANVLKKQTIDYIIKQNDILFDLTGGEIGIATIDNTEGIDADDYVNEMYNNVWKLGDEERNNGFLLVLIINQDDYIYKLGDGTQQWMSIVKAKDIVFETLEPYFAKKEYDEGVYQTFNAILKEYANYYNVDMKNQLIIEDSPNIGKQPGKIGAGTAGIFASIGSFIGSIFSILFIILVIVLISYLIYNSGRRRYYRTYDYNLGPIPPYRSFFWGRPRHHHGYYHRYAPSYHYDHYYTPHHRHHGGVHYHGNSYGFNNNNNHTSNNNSGGYRPPSGTFNRGGGFTSGGGGGRFTGPTSGRSSAPTGRSRSSGGGLFGSGGFSSSGRSSSGGRSGGRSSGFGSGGRSGGGFSSGGRSSGGGRRGR